MILTRDIYGRSIFILEIVHTKLIPVGTGIYYVSISPSNGTGTGRTAVPIQTFNVPVPVIINPNYSLFPGLLIFSFSFLSNLYRT